MGSTKVYVAFAELRFLITPKKICPSLSSCSAIHRRRNALLEIRRASDTERVMGGEKGKESKKQNRRHAEDLRKGQKSFCVVGQHQQRSDQTRAGWTDDRIDSCCPSFGAIIVRKNPFLHAEIRFPAHDHIEETAKC
ncbi:unnamed protein product [Agarophyton chilense]